MTRTARFVYQAQADRDGAGIALRNDQGSLVTVRRDYRKDSGAGVSTKNSSDLLLASRGALG
jgi:hypothetical protein